MSSRKPHNHAHLESHASTAAFFSTLSPTEIIWRDRQPFLERNGYMLRPRYRPGWVPSWRDQPEDSRIPWMKYEDAWTLPARGGMLIDATRISDNKLVYLKEVKRESLELAIIDYLSSPPRSDDPRNHCVQLIDLIEDENDPDVQYIVMPFLRPYDSPPFENVGEFVEFVNQFLEGLAFMHEVGVAHRDCSSPNVMMDPTPLYPDGFHPVIAHFLPDVRTPARPLPRSALPPRTMKYYIIDFGISLYFPEDMPKVAEGMDGIDQEPPEINVPGLQYDPFLLDIFIAGNLLRRRFVDVFSNLSFLSGLTDKMTRQEPSDRPRADAVWQEWARIRDEVLASPTTRSWRLRRKDDPLAVQIGLDVFHVVKAGLSGTSWGRYISS